MCSIYSVLFAVALNLAACTNYNEKLDDLDARLTKLEQEMGTSSTLVENYSAA
ncbi:MAG: hypothetical protein HUJ91_05585, partial [Bacteroidales bacterium]|nr:hypothetical protein [Bacteroidales bacterium]